MKQENKVLDRSTNTNMHKINCMYELKHAITKVDFRRAATTLMLMAMSRSSTTKINTAMIHACKNDAAYVRLKIHLQLYQVLTFFFSFLLRHCDTPSK
jgi:hypothetical protein